VRREDRFIAACGSWGDFWERTKKLSTDRDKGAVFERLTQLYLQTTPEYRTELQHVWLLREVPADIRRRLNLPGPDEGIDRDEINAVLESERARLEEWRKKSLVDLRGWLERDCASLN
jgi:hypothetical protein